MNTLDTVPCYANGTPYRPVYGCLSMDPRPPDSRYDKVLSLTSDDLSWGRFWQIISDVLMRHGYGDGSRQLYRSVMRKFYRFSCQTPAQTNSAIIDDYVNSLVEQDASWNWIAMNISVLRTVFDKLAGQSLTCHLCTPKRPEHLPDVLSPAEVRRILAAAPSTRDQLLLGLMYGCGLKVGEACRLTWTDVDTEHWALTARATNGTRSRALDIPPDLRPVLTMGKSRCESSDFIFQGRFAGTHLSTRMAELIVRKAAESTDSLKTVTCMTLRHSFAVHSLENGVSARALQEALGHLSIDTTLRYQDCILPPGLVSPLDALSLSSPIPKREPRGGAAPLRGPTPKTAAWGRSPFTRLFQQPLSVDALELPFASPPAGHLAQTFQQLFKLHILGRFLCRRGPSPHPD